MINAIDCAQLRGQLSAGADAGELALIDVREQGAYSNGHLFHAACIPLSHLELRIARMVPRKTVQLIICDGGQDNNPLAHCAAQRLQDLGYTDIRILSGALADWQQAGLEIYTGVNVPSKAFGEFVEHWYDTPRLPASELQAMTERGDKLVILDSRPMAEYQRMSIPGGVDCPGAELVYRVHDMAPDPDTIVVVNCAGRTRSIIGAQSLINAGIPNKVFALKDGTMGWQLAGLNVERGRTDHASPPGERGLRIACERAAAIAARFNVPRTDEPSVHAWLQQTDRTTMLLDVRTEQEFLAGHWPGAQHAPGGQLVQATDEFVATRGARLVLLDSADGVRATMTAHWLIQLGWPEVWVMAGLPSVPRTGGAAPDVPGLARSETITAARLQQRLQESGANITVIDLASSLQFRDRHIPGAWWTVRSRIVDSVRALHGVDQIVLMAPEATLAHLAAADLRAAGITRSLSVMEEGLAQWQHIGGAVEQGLAQTLTQVDDVWFKPYDHQGEPHEAMQAYLTWEVGLVEQVEREGLTRFKRFP